MSKKMFKAFDQDFKCRGFQYEVGKTYVHDGKVEVCGSGFHACEDPWSVLNYYPITSRFACVEMSGEVLTEGDKSSAGVLSVIEELSLKQYLDSCVQSTVSKVKGAAAGNGSPSATTGYRSHSATTGYESHSATAGYGSPSATTGDDSPSVTTGYGSPSATTGDDSPSVTTGYRSPSAATGKNSASVCLGLNSTAKCGENGYVAINYWDEEKERNILVVGYEGVDIKADTWYEVKDGKLVEVKEEEK